MKKTLEFSTKFDTSDFDKSVDRMQKRLKDLYAPSDTIRMQSQTANKLQQMGMGVNSPSQAHQERASLQYRKDLDKYIGDEFKKQEALLKLITQREAKFNSLKEKQKEIAKSTDDELKKQEALLKVRETMGRLEENLARQKTTYRQRDEAINAAADIKNAQDQNPELDFSKIGKKTGRPGGMPALIGSIISGLGAVTGFAGNMYEAYTSSPLRTASAVASGINSTIGQDSQNIYNRRSAFEAPYNAERSSAAQTALEANQGYRVKAGTGIAENILGYGGAGSAAGAAATALGGPLTAVGGGIVGGIAGLGTGAYKTLTDPVQRSLIGSYLPGQVGKRFGAEYESGMDEKLGADYQKNLADAKVRNRGKGLASQYYEENYLGNLQSQRSMGLSDEQLYGGSNIFGQGGGLLQQGAASGFTPEMMLNASQGIIGAGGSTQSASGNSLFANKLGRNMDLTNAPQVLGQLSGGLGGSELTKDATIKILSEGMRLGLDNSKFAEENRRFTQAAAEIITRSGANTGADFDRVAGGFGRFMGENTNQGVAAAKTAYEQYQGISSSTTGPRGVMRAAGFLNDDKLSQLSTIDKQALLQLKEEELNESNPLVAGLAEKAGTTVQDFIKRVKGVNQGAVSRFGDADKLRDRLRKSSVDFRRIGDQKYFSSLSKSQRSDISTLMAYQTTELGDLGQRGNISRLAGTVTGNENLGSVTREQTLNGRIEGGMTGTGRGGDVTVAETAKDFAVILQNFRNFKTEIMPSADAVAKFTDKVRELIIVLRTATDPGAVIKAYVNDKAKTQTQGGKPRN